MCGSEDDEDASRCVVVTIMRMLVSVVCGSEDDEDGSQCVVAMMMMMLVGVW